MKLIDELRETIRMIREEQLPDMLRSGADKEDIITLIECVEICEDALLRLELENGDSESK